MHFAIYNLSKSLATRQVHLEVDKNYGIHPLMQVCGKDGLETFSVAKKPARARKMTRATHFIPRNSIWADWGRKMKRIREEVKSTEMFFGTRSKQKKENSQENNTRSRPQQTNPTPGPMKKRARKGNERETCKRCRPQHRETPTAATRRRPGGDGAGNRQGVGRRRLWLLLLLPLLFLFFPLPIYLFYFNFLVHFRGLKSIICFISSIPFGGSSIGSLCSFISIPFFTEVITIRQHFPWKLNIKFDWWKLMKDFFPSGAVTIGFCPQTGLKIITEPIHKASPLSRNIDDEIVQPLLFYINGFNT